MVSGARALTLLCHWGNCKTKEDDIRHTRMQPHVKVRLKVFPFPMFALSHSSSQVSGNVPTRVPFGISSPERRHMS